MRNVLRYLPLLLAAGCAHARPSANAPIAPGNAGSQAAVASTAAAAGEPGRTELPTCAADIDCTSNHLCIEGRCVDPASAPECSRLEVGFDFNSALIRSDARAPLERVSRCLQADRSVHVEIIGNADERGTEEYNMALGDDRARSVERYLEALGVSAGRLSTLSYGKDRPLCEEHDEACWSRNRRADVHAGWHARK